MKENVVAVPLVLEFVDRTLPENHENWYPTKIKPFTVSDKEKSNAYDKLLQWWFVNPDTFVPGRYFLINEFSGLLNRP